jgi:hypothetical protein
VNEFVLGKNHKLSFDVTLQDACRRICCVMPSLGIFNHNSGTMSTSFPTRSHDAVSSHGTHGRNDDRNGHSIGRDT